MKSLAQWLKLVQMIFKMLLPCASVTKDVYIVSIYGAETECIASYTIQSQFASRQIKSLDYFNFIEQVCWLQGIR